MKPCEAEGNCGRTWTSRECWIAGSFLAAGAALGLAAMYLFDPDRGKRRRHLLRDQAQAKLRHARQEVAARVEDATNRAAGAVREAVSRVGRCGEETVSDDVIRDRVRSRLGHLVHPPDQVETEVNQGIVALSGTVPSLDRDALLKDLRCIPGVRGVEDLLVS